MSDSETWKFRVLNNIVAEVLEEFRNVMVEENGEDKMAKEIYQRRSS